MNENHTKNYCWESNDGKGGLEVPTGKRKHLPVKWMFVIKANGKKKARIVAVGNLDTEKYSKGEKRSPTPNGLTVKWFIAHAIRKGWELKQIDIDAAFLNGTIDKTKYIRISRGCKWLLYAGRRVASAKPSTTMK